MVRKYNVDNDISLQNGLEMTDKLAWQTTLRVGFKTFISVSLSLG